MNWSERLILLNPEDIILYTKVENWPDCIQAKEFLIANNIDYTVKDVVENREFMMELVNKHRLMSVPVLVVKDGDPIVGFDKAKYTKVLGI